MSIVLCPDKQFWQLVLGRKSFCLLLWPGFVSPPPYLPCKISPDKLLPTQVRILPKVVQMQWSNNNSCIESSVGNYRIIREFLKALLLLSRNDLRRCISAIIIANADLIVHQIINNDYQSLFGYSCPPVSGLLWSDVGNPSTVVCK
jgi:hypothetical protein